MEAVRPATTGDLDRLSELLNEFDEATQGRRGGLIRRTTDRGRLPVSGDDAGEYLFRADRSAWAGTLDGWVAGMALCRVEDGPDGLGGVIDACFVEEEARELGLGRLLLESSLAWFAAQGCSGVDGIAHPGDRVAKQFFEGAGFTARLLVMHRSLE